MNTLLLITVDCDLRSDTVATRQQTLDILLGLFADTGVAGHVTWFLNENQFFITENHEPFLREAVRRGDTIGVHDHVDFLGGKRREAALHAYFERSQRIITRWLEANGRPGAVRFHRMGCLYQRAECYRALARLGYNVISDVYPGYRMPDHAKEIAFDNSSIPPCCPPYRHDPENFTDWRSTRGHFLHFPIFHMFLHGLEFRKVETWLAIGERAGYEIVPFVWCFHPYELCFPDQDGARNRINAEAIHSLRENIRRFLDHGLKPASLAESATALGG